MSDNDNKIFLEESVLEQVRSIRNDAHLTFIKLGKLRVELMNHIEESNKRVEQFEKAEETLLREHSDLVEKETRVIEEIRKKYGDGELNPESGEFTPNEK